MDSAVTLFNDLDCPRAATENESNALLDSSQTLWTEGFYVRIKSHSVGTNCPLPSEPQHVGAQPLPRVVAPCSTTESRFLLAVPCQHAQKDDELLRKAGKSHAILECDFSKPTDKARAYMFHHRHSP
jgi:hypothetical protein